MLYRSGVCRAEERSRESYKRWHWKLCHVAADGDFYCAHNVKVPQHCKDELRLFFRLVKHNVCSKQLYNTRISYIMWTMAIKYFSYGSPMSKIKRSNFQLTSSAKLYICTLHRYAKTTPTIFVYINIQFV